MKRSASLLLALLLALATALVAAPAQAHTPYCGNRWGSLPESDPQGSSGQVVNVRAGRHTCFDRLVIDVAGGDVGYFVTYLDQVKMDGSGTVVPVRGGARLEVVATAPAAASDAIFLPNGELIDTTGYRTFRHVAWAGSFEGNTSIGLGLRARLPFRVFTLDGPGTGSRLVVDVAHRW